MNEVSHWVKGRLSEPSTYAAASVAAIGGWVLTAQMAWIWVALALAAVAVVMHEKA
jgi:fatty acid desaturase|tara:strand:+ start:1221 stop:1388 length:168 start_codon:yes stop_codon:yes gene_type:complete